MHGQSTFDNRPLRVVVLVAGGPEPVFLAHLETRAAVVHSSLLRREPFFDELEARHHRRSPLIERFIRDAETAKEKRVRLAKERSRATIREARLSPPCQLEERQYHRPKRTGRACGSRYRVMLA